MITDIIEGTINNITNNQEELHKERIKICKSCKLIANSSIFGKICNNKLWLNPETDETSNFYKDGFKNGCGCILNSKTRAKNAKCPLKKW